MFDLIEYKNNSKYKIKFELSNRLNCMTINSANIQIDRIVQ